MSPTLLHIYMNSGQNIFFLRTTIQNTEEEKACRFWSRKEGQHLEEGNNTGFPYYGFWPRRSQSVPWEVAKIQTKAHSLTSLKNLNTDYKATTAAGKWGWEIPEKVRKEMPQPIYKLCPSLWMILEPCMHGADPKQRS